MKYYKVHMSREYSKSGGMFGIVESVPEIENEYLLEDGQDFPIDMLEGISFKFIGSKDDDELGDSLADYQMTYFPWRLISKKFFSVLSKFQSDNIFYYPTKVTKGNEKHDYFLMHFRNTYKSNKKRKFNKIEIFTLSDDLTESFIISEKVKIEIENQSITGLEFELVD